jgi:hypothetical protein
MHQEESRRLRCRGLARTSQRQPPVTVHSAVQRRIAHGPQEAVASYRHRPKVTILRIQIALMLCGQFPPNAGDV